MSEYSNNFIELELFVILADLLSLNMRDFTVCDAVAENLNPSYLFSSTLSDVVAESEEVEEPKAENWWTAIPPESLFSFSITIPSGAVIS